MKKPGIKNAFTPLSFLLLIIISISMMIGLFSWSAVHGKDFEKQEKAVIRVGGDWNYPPYEFLEGGVPSGYNIELIQAVADVMGMDVVIQLGPWNQMRADLETGKIDMLAGMYFSEERDQKVDFSVPHILVTPALFVPNDSPIHKFADIQGKQIVVQQGDIMHDYLLSSGYDLEIVPMTDPVDGLNSVYSGNYDAVLLSSSAQGLYLIDEYSFSSLRAVQSGLPLRRYCFAVQEGNQTLLNQLNEGLYILQKSGKYQQIHEKWFGVYEVRTFWQKARPYAVAFGMVFAGFVLSLLWARFLKQQVMRRTRQLQLLEERYAHAFHTSPDMITVIRMSDGVHVDVNQGFANLTGFEAEETLGKTAVELGIWPDDTIRSSFFDELFRQGSLVNRETPLRRKDGSLWEALISAHRIEFNGEACGLWITRDITQRKQIEMRVRRQVAHLESLRKVDSAIIAHLNMKETFEILLSQVQEQLNVDAVAALLFDTTSQSFICLAQRGMRASAEFDRYLQEITDLNEVLKNTLPAGFNEGACFELDSSAFNHEFFKRESFEMICSVLFAADENRKGILQVCNRSPLIQDEDWKRYLHIMAGQAAIILEHASLFEALQQRNLELTQAYDDTIAGWATALELRDMETQNHSRRVAQLTSQLAMRMGISGEAFVHLRRGALLHDIGKMSIPDAILLKPGPLTAEEWAVMRQHPIHACNLLSSIEFLKPALDIPYCHHENWDGSGYPRGLAGEEIPIAARIFAVVDNWDALSSDRPYRPAWQPDEVLRYLKAQAGTKFDPVVVEAFLNLLDDLPLLKNGL